MAKQAKKILRIKQSISWHYMSWALETLRGDGILNQKEYEEYFKPLESFVNDHITIPDGLEVLDEYVVCECVKHDDKNARRL